MQLSIPRTDPLEVRRPRSASCVLARCGPAPSGAGANRCRCTCRANGPGASGAVGWLAGGQWTCRFYTVTRSMLHGESKAKAMHMLCQALARVLHSPDFGTGRGGVPAAGMSILIAKREEKRSSQSRESIFRLTSFRQSAIIQLETDCQ